MMNKYEIVQAILNADLTSEQLAGIESILSQASKRKPDDDSALYAKYMDLLDSLDEVEQEEYLKLLMTFVK